MCIRDSRISLKIGPHDLEMRKNQALKFLEKGDKVKVEMILRGRERTHAHRAREMMEQFANSLSDNIIVEQSIKQQGGRLSMLLSKK